MIDQNKREWIKYRYVGGRRAVWHLPAKDNLKLPACKSNGPITGNVEAVVTADLIPLDGQVCKHCANLLYHELKRGAVQTVRETLVRIK